MYVGIEVQAMHHRTTNTETGTQASAIVSDIVEEQRTRIASVRFGGSDYFSDCNSVARIELEIRISERIVGSISG